MAAAVVLHLAIPLAGPLPWSWRLIGVAPLLAGAVLTVGSAAMFGRRDTNIKTFNDPGVLVTNGAFGQTRNPMYLGFVLMLIGVALLFGSVTVWVCPVLFFAIADRWYVPFEERRMQATFGATFDDYRAQVPRWIGRPAR